jgi:transposase-like protein
VRSRVYAKQNDEHISPEVRARAVRMVTEHEAEHSSRWAAVSSIAAKIGRSAHSLHEWVKKAEVDSGKRAGLPGNVAEKMKALEGEPRASSGE